MENEEIVPAEEICEVAATYADRAVIDGAQEFQKKVGIVIDGTTERVNIALS